MDHERIYAEESLVVELGEALAGRMQDQGLDYIELAKRLGTTQDKVKAFFQGRKVDLRFIVALVHAMGGKLEFSVRDWDESKDSYMAKRVA